MDHKGRALIAPDALRLSARYNQKNLTVHRADLQYTHPLIGMACQLTVSSAIITAANSLPDSGLPYLLQSCRLVFADVFVFA